MNILFVNEKLGFFGGVEQYVYDTARRLSVRGHRCTLSYAERTTRDPDVYAEAFARTYACGALLDAEPDARRFRTVVEDARPDVVYVHKVTSIAACRVPGDHTLVRMVHDHDLCCPRRHKYYRGTGRVCRRPAGWRCWLDLAFLQPDGSGVCGIGYRSIPDALRERDRNRVLGAVVVASRFMEEELVDNGFEPDRVHRIPLGIASEEIAAGPVPSDCTVLFVGQLVRGKGADLLLRALAKTGAPFQAILAGDGNARGELEILSRRLGLEDRVTFAGWVAHGALDAYYARARVVAVPSRWPEPFGLIGLEAMARGRPVVAFQTGGIPDWLGDGVTGIGVPEQDTSAFAAALDRLLLDLPTARAMGRAARERVERRFRTAHHIAELEALFEERVAGGGVRSATAAKE